MLTLSTPSVENIKQKTDQGVDGFIHLIAETKVSEKVSLSRKEENVSSAKFHNNQCERAGSQQKAALWHSQALGIVIFMISFLY